MPNPLRSHALMVYGLDKHGNLQCEIQSDLEPKYYRLVVRVSDGRVSCECPHFQFRCKGVQPTIYSGQVCKHCATWREYLQKEVAALRNEITIDQAKEESETLEGEALVAATEQIFNQ